MVGEIRDVTGMDPETREGRMFAIVDDTLVHGVRFRVGRFAIIERDCRLGDDCVVGDYVKLYPGTTFGNGVEIDEYADTSGAVLCGDHVKIKKKACFGQGSIMEDWAWLGPYSILIHEKHISWGRSGSQASRGVYVHAGAVIGSHVKVVSGVTIDYNAWVGTGSVVTKDCEENGIYVGNPARRIGIVPPGKRIPIKTYAPLQFDDAIREKYLPHLQGVGRYDV